MLYRIYLLYDPLFCGGDVYVIHHVAVVPEPVRIDSVGFVPVDNLDISPLLFFINVQYYSRAEHVFKKPAPVFNACNGTVV